MIVLNSLSMIVLNSLSMIVLNSLSMIVLNSLSMIVLNSLSMIVLNSRDWSEIVWPPEISRFKINLAIIFIRKNRWDALVRL